MNMLRCSRGHLLCSVDRFRELERKYGMIADWFCEGCKDWVPADTRTNMELMRASD